MKKLILEILDEINEKDEYSFFHLFDGGIDKLITVVEDEGFNEQSVRNEIKQYILEMFESVTPEEFGISKCYS